MTFADDERGQPVVIGALLIFTILILAFAGYQAFAVPNQNAEVEFNHSQEVESEMVDVRVGIVRSAISGSDSSTSVKLGTRYPNRLLALNPPPVTGRLETTDPQPITVNHQNDTRIDVCAPGEISGEDATRTFVYQAGYNEYRTESTVIYENTFAYSQFTDDGTVERLRSDQRLINNDDQTIELIALEGEYSESGVERSSVDFIRGETREKSIPNPEITVPTRVENSEFWENEVLNGEGTVTDFEPGQSVTFEPNGNGNFDVRCTPVGVNDAPVSGSSGIVRPGSGEGGNNDGGDNTGGDPIQSASVSDLVANDGDQTQTFTFELSRDYSEGETVEINLDEPYDSRGSNTRVDYLDGDNSQVVTGSGSASLQTQGNQDATLTYTSGSGGDSAGTVVRIDVGMIEVGDVPDEEYEVTFTDDDGNTLRRTFVIKTDDAGGTRRISRRTEGSVYSSGEVIVQEDGNVLGDIEGDEGVEMREGSEASGDVRSPEGSVEITGDGGTTVDGNVTAEQSITLKEDAVIAGSTVSGGPISIREGAEVARNVNTDSSVDINEGGYVGGAITSGGDVNIVGDSGPTVDEDVTADGTVSLGEDAIIAGDVNVDSGDDIVCSEGSEINGQSCGNYKNENY
jgi:cytoskeletal protein CcmA (bactofilin family)